VRASEHLGRCGAYLPETREPCDGWLVIDREDDKFLEASCSECGAVAGRPKSVVRSSDPEPEREEVPWYQR
jgi:hypothetical protein